MWWLWFLFGLSSGALLGWFYASFVLGRGTGVLLINNGIMKGLIKALIGVCEPHCGDPKVVAVIKYTQDALESLKEV